MKKLLILPMLTLMLTGCGTKYATPPAPLQPEDFPAHQVDLDKYGIERVERKWNPEIKVPKDLIDEVVAEEQTSFNYNSAYTLIYNNIQLSRLNNDTLRKYDSYEDIPFKEEKDVFRACVNEAEADWDRKRDEICKGEKILNPSRVERYPRLEQQEKNGTISEGGKEGLEAYRNDPSEIYSGCHLPAEVQHQLYIRQYSAWDQCEIDYRKMLAEKGYLK